MNLAVWSASVKAMSGSSTQQPETKGSNDRPPRAPPSTLYSFHPQDRVSPVENVDVLDTARSCMRENVMEEVAFDFCARVFEASIEETQVRLAKAEMERRS